MTSTARLGATSGVARTPAGYSVWLDVGPVVVLAFGALLAVSGQRRVEEYLALMVVVLPLLGRRRWPAVVFGLAAAASVATATSTENPFVQIAAVALASESVGQYLADRTRSAVFVLATAGLMTVSFLVQDADPALSLVLPLVVVAPSWIVGDTIRTRRLESLARAAAAEREILDREARLRAMVAEERRHVARELHDVVAHSVSVMLVQAGAARQVLRTTPDLAEESLLAVEATGRGAMAELRRLLGALSDVDDAGAAAGAAGQATGAVDEAAVAADATAVITDATAVTDGGGLWPQPGVDQLGALVRRVRAAGLAAELEIDGDHRALPTSLDVTVYRIVQEALTNALRYADRARTVVHLTYEPDQLRVEVLNDGSAGSRPGEPGVGTGQGLVGLRERASLAGGRLEAGPRLSGGYAVRAWLPLQPLEAS
jgi:signal transduction histidine kinase